MKKLIAVLTLFLAFNVTANAQDKKAMTSSNTASPEMSALDKGRKEATELSEFLSLDKTTTENLTRLFEQKHTYLDDKNLSPERRVETSRVIDAKLRATLDTKQMDKLDKNPALLKKMTN